MTDIPLRDQLRDFVCDHIFGPLAPPQTDAFRYNACEPLAEALMAEFDIQLRSPHPNEEP